MLQVKIPVKRYLVLLMKFVPISKTITAKVNRSMPKKMLFCFVVIDEALSPSAATFYYLDHG